MSRLGAWWRRWVGAGEATSESAGASRQRRPFKLKYGYFRELLAANDLVLEVIAELEDKLAGTQVFGLETVRSRIESASYASFVIVKNLNLISDGRYPQLYDALDRINGHVQAAFGARRHCSNARPVVALADAGRDDAPELGAKMANLGEVRNRIGLPVPDGFVVTTAAYDRLVEHNNLADKIAAEFARLGEADGSLATVSQAIRALILGAEIPADLRVTLQAALVHLAARIGDPLPGGRPLRLAVRSSAVGEDDTAASSAGQYRTLLGVTPADLPASYLEVVASLYTPGAIAYRRQRGQLDVDTAMAVGCVAMLDAVAAGVMFTRDPACSDRPRVVIDAVPGQGATVVDGTAAADHFVLQQSDPPLVLERHIADKAQQRVAQADGDLVDVELAAERRRAPCIDDDHLIELARTARLLEKHFGAPQDAEWVLTADGQLHIVQSRPLGLQRFGPQPEPAAELVAGFTLLLQQGITACPGVGAGVVFRVEREADLDRVPDHAVLVARHSSPTIARVMRQVSAIVTEIGSVTGHMAIVAREFGVPTLINAPGALTLPVGAAVTVDAGRARVYQGTIDQLLVAAQGRRAPMTGTPVFHALEGVARHLCPLHLVDPAAATFKPAHCDSLHDIARFAHEQTFAEMFHIGDDVKRSDEAHGVKLRAHLPIEVYVFDLGGALQPGAAERREVGVDAIAAVPLKAFVDGLTDPTIHWDRPRPVHLGGFLSVLSESMVSPPPSKYGLGRRSFAMASDTYLNFSTRAGYHFSTVDSYCGRSVNKNYIHFRFAGGAASEQRRARRARFVGRVLERLGFSAQAQGDVVVARLQKYEQDFIRDTLTTLGRLTMCTRQLDMLMNSDAAVDDFVDGFCQGRYELFC